MARVKQSVAQVAVKLSAADLAALDDLVGRHQGHPLDGIDQVRNRSDVLRVAIRTLAFLSEPFDDAEVLHMQELATRFGTSPVLVLSALLNDANVRAIVKRNLDDMTGRRPR
jgi:hypothetical protein